MSKTRVKPHNSQTGNTLDQIQILISLFQSPRPLYPLYKNILYDEPVTLQLLPVRVILLIKHAFAITAINYPMENQVMAILCSA